MKVVAPAVQVIEVAGEGLMSFLEKPIMLMTPNFIYSGTLVGVNDEFVKLSDAGIVFETGAFSNKNYKDFQKFDADHYVMKASIISFGAGKN